MRKLLPTAVLAGFVLLGCGSSVDRVDRVDRDDRDGTPIYWDVGETHRAITTDSAEAQLWFDRGLGLAFGFNHEEAQACFERALEADADCAICEWGVAYVLGPNYNNTEMTEATVEGAYAASRRAQAKADGASDAERALIDAVAARYAMPAPEDRSSLDRAYADAMRAAAAAHPDDADVAALTAEAVMMLRPWKLWSHAGEPAPETPEIVALLEAGLARWPDHPALCHLYIHAMEAGPNVALATPAAEALDGAAGGLGHLIHMSSHIYTWTGRYDDVIRVNQAAVEVDRAFVEHAGRENFYTLYRLHNLHFVAYGGMWTGRRELALDAAHELVAELPPALIHAEPDFTEIFVGTPYHVMVRFGMWDEILATPSPGAGAEHEELLYSARAIWRYARGIALASLGRVDDALAEQRAFRAAREAVPESRLLFQNPVHQILAVADHVLAGEIAYRRGDHPKAFEHLREAVVLDDTLNYDEPWGWMEPARHPLGALLVEQGRFAEAESVYRADLAKYPDNGWALHGLAEALDGLGRADEAGAMRARFEAAFAKADVTIPGSCFCKAAA